MGELLGGLSSVDDRLTVYLRRSRQLSPSSPISLIDEDVDPAPVDGVYLLEVGLIKEVLEVWRAWRGGAEPTAAEASAAVSLYADRDAFAPPP